MKEYSKELELVLEESTRVIDPIIKEILVSDVDKKFHNIVKYQVTTGGKRLRPALAIISCKVLGGNIKDVLYPAAGLEILHNSTLIVDDIIDNSSLRRNKPTTWFKFGRSITECIAPHYFAAVFQSVTKSNNQIEVLKLFASTLKTIMDGEILDILFEQSGREDEKYIVNNRYKEVTERSYQRMVSKKSASLLAASCEIGGIAAKGKPKHLNALRNYGFNLGIAFQITDDILDILGKEKNFGKIIGNDIVERKLGNITILYALKKLSLSDKKRFLKILRKEKINNKDVKEGIKIIEKTDARNMAKLLAEEFIEKSKNSLNSLPKNRWSGFLAQIADSVIEREQ